MLSNIINFSLKNKFIVLLFTTIIIGFGLYSLSQISIGAVPDVTNNQVQVITTSRNLSTQDMEQFITYPVELEMANLPGVVEIRSVSKFGLSVVTIVFEDNMGTFLPRQLIAEKIKSASEKIPEGFGTPEMGPITTGLGEIYQYVLDVKPEYKNRYTATDLRTIQDWIVKRQLSGIPGVVEVNTWGGFLKEYEIAIDTGKLNAMNITAQEVFKALELNNGVAGGGYIERINQAYFIRGEGLVKSLEDINTIVVKNVAGNPIYIKDIATVGYGSAMRFGAITGNGEGEKVLGQVMMLKDANSKEVIEAVKERVASISKSLPEGVYINGFLDRSELIGRTTFTVTENLVLGCLIVIFVVVLLLGNVRSGLVVASVIPLCLLFALSLMYIFGVDANLMSLGAIDFGIIIDGAVIIVEYIAYQITLKQKEILTFAKAERQDLKDDITFKGASKMMNSAIFGQLIILIVFIPVLSLSGVEGKMFTPMALTFSFALIGAMVFCFTYVPVVSALFLKPSKNKNNLTAQLIRWLTGKYSIIIHWALSSKRLVLGIAASLLVVTLYLFTTMGGEFVPTLDEGDFVIQPVLKTGTSLSNTVKTTTQIEQILLKNFPEVKQVVTRIGAAEVPTDPMSMEESDVIIQLKPKNEWVSADTKDELADKFKEALAVIPGMEVEFTQPIEMRFNELITGVRADIAIKVFGEDLSVLAAMGEQIKELVRPVEGAADVTVEKVEGLPQMNVTYNRAKVARYGLNIHELNEMVSMGFSGRSVGSVFEGEKRFDMVVRLNKEHRKDLSNLKNLYVDLPNGGKVPLSEVAEITYQKGAAKISRDNTRRRIVVGINVRNRDLQSVVDDVEEVITNNIKLPVGYSITYGGQFENLQSAKARLKIAVPIVLILIFVLLYFAFKSVMQALLVYSAIPLAAVGGVLFLLIRGMPFSISAGVGFIALFGIAVLNGIVLIEHFKELKSKGYPNIESLIEQGAKDRLRAVLLTASAAALGFLPMAVSTNAGAEVQRPLATVVIGGLITATLLTLVVLPVLYAMFHDKWTRKIRKRKIFRKRNTTLLLLLTTLGAFAQQSPKTLQELTSLAIENNASMKVILLEAERSDALIGSAFSFDKTQIYFNYDQNNLALNNEPLRVFGISQDFQFPTVYFSNKKLKQAKYNLAQSRYQVQETVVKEGVTIAFYNYQIALEKQRLYQALDSLYERFAYAANRRFELGETNYLEKITAQSKKRQITLQYEQAISKSKVTYTELKHWVQAEDSLVIAKIIVDKIPITRLDITLHPSIRYFENRVVLRQREAQYEKQLLIPDLNVEYFQGTNNQLNGNLFGYQIGIKIPLLFSGQASRIKAANIARKVATEETHQQKHILHTRYVQFMEQLKQQQGALDYYETEGNLLAEEILKTADHSFKNGEIDFFQYIQSLENAYEIKVAYLNQLQQYNETVVKLNYLTF
ncbi:CusA/CzcA family heavy metal efflux RND transporter [Flavivirga eckloniae]|uniref:CusA/CzcA family heavy metal efflux RND transporter n=1 Tax=Flavivirga eckloniae TaxID=1803846 RepID=A0A2K9PUE6_9FLAO|nr:CusA/CzcA family heavy metal efflux RND transporter [Flavivirga eckloniae]AUP80167.1 CusA/CzcA family heavy metal efflux RND transporter [Flavivirga eckloniae]